MTARPHPFRAAAVMRNNESHWSGLKCIIAVSNSTVASHRVSSYTWELPNGIWTTVSGRSQ